MDTIMINVLIALTTAFVMQGQAMVDGAEQLRYTVPMSHVVSTPVAPAPAQGAVVEQQHAAVAAQPEPVAVEAPAPASEPEPAPTPAEPVAPVEPTEAPAEDNATMQNSNQADKAATRLSESDLRAKGYDTFETPQGKFTFNLDEAEPITGDFMNTPEGRYTLDADGFWTLG